MTLDNNETLKTFGNCGTLMKLDVLGARDISALSVFPEEAELIMLPNSLVEVVLTLSAQEVR